MTRVLSANFKFRSLFDLKLNLVSPLLKKQAENRLLLQHYSWICVSSLMSNNYKHVMLHDSGFQKYVTRKFSDVKPKTIPLLMDFQPVYAPNYWYMLQNVINTMLIIKPHLDNEFTIARFLEGATQALIVISNYLADGNVDALKGLVTEEAINEIERNIAKFSLSQRENLRVRSKEIVASFAYRIGIIMTDAGKRFVEITVVFCCNRTFAELEKRIHMADSWQKLPNFNDLIEPLKDKGTVCNYRFIREYTKGVESDWIVNQLNHYNREHLDEE